LTLLAGSQIGKYVVQRKLAEGGMAEIFVASSFGPEGFEKQVIIKRIRAGLASDPAFIKMFVSEARLVSRLNHANIVQIFDFDRHEDTFYIAMEYVRGVSLAQAHSRARELQVPVPPLVAAQVAIEVARGLSFAHRLTEHGEPLGIVHRDVTPQNILLSYEGAVKLTDFGIAKAGTRASTVGMLKGKFAYMSPEQSRGEPVDSRTDVFALGITLWELLTGQQLFDAESDIAVLRAVQEKAVASPEAFNPGVDAALATIVMRCLERERTERFQSAQELERALNRYVINQTERSEEMEVATWIRGLFPDEAIRTEGSVARHVPSVGHERAAAVGPGSLGLAEGGAVVHRSTSLPQPPVFLPAANSGASRSPTGATPVLSAERVWEESPTRRQMRAWWTRKPWAVGATAVAIALTALGLHFRSAKVAVEDRGPSAAAPVEPLTPAQPSPTAPAPTPSAPVKSANTAGVAASGARRATTSHPPAAETGTLELTVGPFGEVFIDGKTRGDQFGTVSYRLTPGEHQLDIKGAVHWGPKKIQIQSGRTYAQSAWVQ
jgi:serine/threonine protein kinase